MPRKKKTLAEALFGEVNKSSVKKFSISQLDRREDIGFDLMNKLFKKFKAGKMSVAQFRAREYKIVKKIEMIQLRATDLRIKRNKKTKSRKRKR